VKEPTEHLTTMAESLAVLRERLPEWPPIKSDESKIRPALQVLTPEYRAAARSRNRSALSVSSITCSISRASADAATIRSCARDWSTRGSVSGS